MSDGAERRRFKRIDVRIPVRLYVPGESEPLEGEIRNISVGGALVHTDHVIPDGKNVLLEFKLADVELIHARVAGPEIPTEKPSAPGFEGEVNIVRWIEKVAGSQFGVEFVNLRPKAGKFIEDLVDYLEKVK